jgi:general secretion pathway protein G
MLASARLARSNTRRAAFTLVEVLVVVAIVVILASVGTLATFKFLEDAKVDTARAKAENLVTAVKAWQVKNDNQQVTDITVVLQFLEGGEKGLLDPWGQPYQIQYVQDPSSPYPRPFVFTNAMVDGQQRIVGAPKDLEMQMNNGQ